MTEKLIPDEIDEAIDAEIEQEITSDAESPSDEKDASPQSYSYQTPDLARETDVYASLWGVARRVAGTEFVPSSFRGSPEKVFAAILQGRALGVDAMTSLREITVIEGKPSLSAELQLALVRKAGHEVTGESYADKATVTGRRVDTGEEMTVVYTLEDAVTAGLVQLKDGKPYARSQKGNPLPWERYTANMLFWRAVTNLTGRLFPDCMIGEAL